MKFRPLGNTGLQVSEMGFGCWAIGGNSYGDVRDSDSLEALETAWDSGVTFFDTADVYGEGHSEILLGKFLKGKPRSGMVVATKAGWNFYGETAHSGSGRSCSAVHRKDFTTDYLGFACEQSLKRLGIETIDLYQLHNPSLEQIQKGEAISALEKLKQEGKIRFLGISVHTAAEALAALEDSRVDVLQVILNLLDQRMTEKVLPRAASRGVGILAREPLASGLLTGKYAPDHEFPKNDHRRRWAPEKRECDGQKIQRLRKTLEGASISLSQAALEFVLSFGAVATVIPGAKTRRQVLENLGASSSPRLSQEMIRKLKELYETEPIFRQGLIPR